MTEKLLAVLFLFISKVIAATGYAGITLLMAIESACIPLPSELIMPFGGYLVFQGTFKLLWLATAGALGCNLGSLVALQVGWPGGGRGAPSPATWARWSPTRLDAMAAAQWSSAMAAGFSWDAANSTGRTASSRAGDISPCSSPACCL